MSVGDVVTNLAQHANAGDTNYFSSLLGPSHASETSHLLAMIQRSGMVTNYSRRVRRTSPTLARLDYCDIERGCHFQVEMQKESGGWSVSGIWLCR
jgi:hypothetical protein